MMDLKKLFPIFDNNKNLIFFDSGASAQKPNIVIDGMDDFYRKNYANIHRGVYKLSQNSSNIYDESRVKVANFIGVTNPKEVIFTKGTTDAINMLTYSLQNFVNKGDIIMVGEAEHHSNLIPWRELGKRVGAVIHYIPICEDGSLDYSWIEKNINKDVKIVAVSGQSNVLGVQNDVKRICNIARSVGAYSVIDGAQLVSHFKIDVGELGCDFLAFSGHKLYGPTGVGVLYGRSEVLNIMPPAFFGGDMVKSVSVDDVVFADIPAKFEAGTPPIVEVYGLALAIDFLNEIGMDKVEKYIAELSYYIVSNLINIKGVKIISGVGASGVISFVIDGVSSFDVGTLLSDKNVCVRVGRHCADVLHDKLGLSSSIRISFGIYNNKEDIDKFILLLNDIIKILR